MENPSSNRFKKIHVYLIDFIWTIAHPLVRETVSRRQYGR